MTPLICLYAPNMYTILVLIFNPVKLLGCDLSLLHNQIKYVQVQLMMIYLLNKIGVSLEFPFIHLVCTIVIINW